MRAAGCHSGAIGVQSPPKNSAAVVGRRGSAVCSCWTHTTRVRLPYDAPPQTAMGPGYNSPSLPRSTRHRKAQNDLFGHLFCSMLRPLIGSVLIGCVSVSNGELQTPFPHVN